MQGFSRTNLYNMRKFYLIFSAYNEKSEIVPQPGGQYVANKLPWSHIKILLDKVEKIEEITFYIHQTVENSWSRNILAIQIKSNLYNRSGRAITNFTDTLPAPQSDLATQTIKDPYIFDFLTMTIPYNELDIEKQLIQHIAQFLMELGKGFAFLGRQYPLEVNRKSYFLDLLFYHTKLKCYVVVELKNTSFIPEFTGKLNFYLSAVDSLVKAEDDNPSIGLLLCRDKNNFDVEFSLRDMNKPIGVSEYILTENLPKDLKGAMPTVEEIEIDLKGLVDRGLNKK